MITGVGVIFIGVVVGVRLNVLLSTTVGVASMGDLLTCLLRTNERSKIVAIITTMIPKTKLVYDSPKRKKSKTVE